ncbi:kelch domain-containing protein [Cercophora newfieldiana]|uniref:Kelch domain-containing protein n=1 Tax=Cercophora newfieldiana TaxID=92897 RepID=A0AA39Y702_9PEZI|nr:kelch domain-containing protein [Cercophora newfieldiana]
MRASQLLQGLLTLLAPLSAAQTWTDLSPIPLESLQEHITLSPSANQIVTVGGMVGNGVTTNAVLLYDIPSNSWKTGAPLPTALNHPNAVVSEGKVYVVGGLTGASGWPATPNSWVYDPAKDSWDPLAAISSSVARGSAASAVWNGTIFIAGGIPRSGGRTVDTVSAYSIASNSWLDVPEAAARMPGARDHAAYAQIDNKMFVLGGRQDGVRAVKDTVFILDLANLGAGWKTSSAKMPTARGGLVAAVVGAKIYTFGGEGNQAPNTRGVFNQTEVYDTVADTWSKEEAMKLPRHGTSAVGVGGKIYIPGGGIVEGVGATKTFDVFDP